MIPDAIEAEGALLGAVLTRPALLEDVAHLLVGSDFHVESTRTAWLTVVGAWRDGDPLDAVTLSAARPELDKAQIATWLASWGGGRLSRYVEAIVAARARRDLIGVANVIAGAAQEPHFDPFAARDEALSLLQRIDTPAVVPHGLSTLRDFLARPQKIDEWVIPGLVGEGWRAVVVAPEGFGKMWLLRQLAVAAAGGVHPLALTPVATPKRTLMVDLENPEQQVRQSTRRMIREAERFDYADDRCWIWHQPGGIDIRNRAGRAQLDAVFRESKPDLVCLGPLYKLYRSGRDDMETAAHEVQQILDDMRVRHGFALVLEHHAPKPQGGQRDILPFGSSLWLRWPELGIKLLSAEKGPPGSLSVGRWRPDRLPTAWPQRIDRGQGWPWVGVWRDSFDAAFRETRETA